MTKTNITKIGVIGAGTMGSGIALVALRTGFSVTLYDIAPVMLEKAEKYIEKHLTRKGQEAALSKLTVSDNLESLAGSDVVIEAALEKIDLKQELFGKLDSICPPPAILASNTSTLAVTAIASASTSPERVAGMHFFNPAPVLPLVEVIQGAQSNQEIVQTLIDLAKDMGKTPVLAGDNPGFIVNRVARPFYGEALRLVGERVATHQQIDQIVTLGGTFRMGPFQLMDLIGIDINFTATQSMYTQSFYEARYRPHYLQEQKVQQNALGIKTGRGFYTYNEEHPRVKMPTPPEQSTTSGNIFISTGSWALGLSDLCQQAGYTLTQNRQDKLVAGLIVASRAEALVEEARRLDQLLAPTVPLICQANDTTVAEISTWLEYPERLVGFDGLFIAQGRAATLVASPTLATDIQTQVETFFTNLGRLPIWVADAPALVLPRIVCMLANEAFFAAGEGVAQPETIDQAMTLGVNYPKGPISWAKEIGYKRVVAVLDHLQAEYGEERYRTAPLLRRSARLGKIQISSVVQK